MPYMYFRVNIEGKHDGRALTFLLTMCYNWLCLHKNSQSALICEVRGRPLPNHKPFLHIQSLNMQIKARLKSKKCQIWLTWTYNLIFRVIILTTFLHHNLCLYPVITIMSSLRLQCCQKNNRQRSSCNLWNESAYLTTELLCLLRLCVRPRVNTPTFTSSLVWILSLLPLTRQLFLCLFAMSVAFMVTTHTGGQRGEPSGRRWMGLTHLWEVGKTHKVQGDESLLRRIQRDKLRIKFHFIYTV